MRKRRRAARTPSTVEEKEYHRQRCKMFKLIWSIGTVLFVSIFIIVPKVPNNAFYLELNSFLDNHLFASFLPEFSDKFYFSIKVAWYFTFVYQLILVFVWNWFVRSRLGYKGVRTLLYLARYDSREERNVLAVCFIAIFAILASFYVPIDGYSFPFKSHPYSRSKPFYDFFYGNFIGACGLFLFLQVIVCSGMIFLLTMFFNFFVVWNGDFDEEEIVNGDSRY